MPDDAEINALQAVVDALEPLDHDARARVLARLLVEHGWPLTLRGPIP